MIGLGVGIDYALFIVTRYRENLHNGHGIEAGDARRHRHRRPGRRFRRHHGRHLAARHARHGAAASSPASPSAPPSVVAVTMVASLTLLPALLGFAGERVEVTRWRGLIAAGLVAVALVGVGLGIPAADRRSAAARPSSCCSASFAVAPLRKRGAASASAKPLARDVRPTAGAASSSTTRGRRARRRGGPRRCSPLPVLRPAPRLLRRGQLPRGHHHPPGLRPAGRGLRPRLQRPARPGQPRCPTGTDAGDARGASTDAVGRRPRAWPSSARRSRTTTATDGRAVAGHPDHRPAGRGHRPTSSTACATTCSPPPPTAPASTSPSPAASPSTSTSPTTSPRGCPCSSAPCWRCRSCC